MRIPLVELNPAWLSTSMERGRMGFDFECPCGRHRQEVWFSRPIDADAEVTQLALRRTYDVEGDDFGNLWVIEPLRCGDDLLFVYSGSLVVG